MKENKLTPKQERFIQNIVSGMSQRQAYKEAYNAENMKDETIDNEAYKLFKSPDITTRYNELIGELQDKTIMSAKERMQWLTDVINNEQQEDIYITTDNVSIKVGSKNADLNTKIKALDTLNKMSGEYVTNIKGNIGVTYEETLKKVSDPDEY